MGWWNRIRSIWSNTETEAATAPPSPDTPPLIVPHPLIAFGLNTAKDFGAQVGALVPVFEKLSYNPIMSTITEAQIDNIKAMLPIIGTDMALAWITYLMTASANPDPSMNSTGIAPEADSGNMLYIAMMTGITGGLITLQFGLTVYDRLMGMKQYSKVWVERQLTPLNMPAPVVEASKAPCNADCLSFTAALNGNIYKSLNYYANSFFINNVIEPVPLIGYPLAVYLRLMADGRFLYYLGASNHCMDHKTVKPETALAYGAFFRLEQHLMQTILLDYLGIPSSHYLTLSILQEIPLIISTALVNHLNPPPINKFEIVVKQSSPPQKTTLQDVIQKQSRRIIYNPLGEMARTLEWLCQGFLVGCTWLIKDALKNPGSSIDWPYLKTQANMILAHEYVQTAKTYMVPQFLQSFEEIANHPPVRHQWESNRKFLLGFLEKIFVVKNSTLGIAASYKPEYAAQVIQFFLNIKASLAKKIIKQLGEEQTIHMLHALYWWLGKHGVYKSMELEGKSALFPDPLATIEIPKSFISKSAFKNQQPLLLQSEKQEEPTIEKSHAEHTENKEPNLVSELPGDSSVKELPKPQLTESPKVIPVNTQTTTNFFKPLSDPASLPKRAHSGPLSKIAFRNQEHSQSPTQTRTEQPSNMAFFNASPSIKRVVQEDVSMKKTN